jgi:hypothetical protein
MVALVGGHRPNKTRGGIGIGSAKIGFNEFSVNIPRPIVHARDLRKGNEVEGGRRGPSTERHQLHLLFLPEGRIGHLWCSDIIVRMMTEGIGRITHRSTLR